MPDIFSITLQDYSKELATVTFPIRVITAGNLAAIQSDVTTLVTAMQDVAFGTMRRRQVTHNFTGDPAIPTDPEAQREEKWTVGYTDVQATLAAGVTNPLYGNAYTVTLSTALLTGHLSVNSDYANLADTDVACLLYTSDAADDLLCVDL